MSVMASLPLFAFMALVFTPAFGMRLKKGRFQRILNKNSTGLSKQPAFYMVQLADPQLGLKTFATFDDLNGAKDYSKEENNLKAAVAAIMKLKPLPKFVLVSGDMQNYYSQNWETNKKSNGGLGPDNARSALATWKEENSLGLADNELTEVTDYGMAQAWAVKKAMKPLEDLCKTKKDGRDLCRVRYTPGNHDLDDNMNKAVLDRYRKLWPSGKKDRRGKEIPSDRDAFLIDDVYFIMINSQFYYKSFKDNDKSVRREILKQDKWLDKKIKAAQKSKKVKKIVAATHIPPFVKEKDEIHGWANWELSARTNTLNNIYKKKGKLTPALWLCGHFHGNIRTITTKDTMINGHNFEVMTTGAVGDAMIWDNNPSLSRADDEYVASDGLSIAAEPNGAFAFFNRLIGCPEGCFPKKFNFNTWQCFGEGPSLEKNKARVTPAKEWAGVRIVQFYNDGSYRHKWFTLNALQRVTKIDDNSMQDAYNEGDKIKLPEQ